MANFQNFCISTLEQGISRLELCLRADALSLPNFTPQSRPINRGFLELTGIEASVDFQACGEES